MKQFLVLLLCLPMLAFGQSFGPSPGPAPTPIAPSYLMPPGKIYVDRTKIPKPRSSEGVPLVRTHCDGPVGSCNSYSPAESTGNQAEVGGAPINSGAFRILCKLSHVSFDDPIVYPGKSGLNHLHQFSGNNTTGPTTNPLTFATTGRSTCDGGNVNRSGYWVPVIIYHCPAGSTNGCTRSRNGEPIFATSFNFYYKCEGSFTCDSIVWPPNGFRMITGDPNNTLPNKIPGRIECSTDANGAVPYGAFFDHLPSKAELTAKGAGTCKEYNFLIPFPECWDGVNLDSPTHIGHMKSSDYYAGCTDPNFPQLIPSITLNVHTTFNTNDVDYFRLSSDLPASSGVPAGYSLHADWLNGWDQTPNFMGTGKTLVDHIMEQCYGKGHVPSGLHRDCHDDNIGNIFGDSRWFFLDRR